MLSRARWLLVVVVVAASCLGSVDLAQAAHRQPVASGCVADAELKVGDTGASVICLQYALGMIGLSTLPITAAFDQATSDLVRWFQATHPPLLVDGRAGPQTLAALGIWSGRTLGPAATPGAPATAPCTADATIRLNDISPSVRCLQETLRELGLYVGRITGVSDAATVEAVRRYQTATPPLEADGAAGPRTLAALGIWSGRAGLQSSNRTVVFATGSAPPAVQDGRPGGPAPPGPWPAPIQPEKEWRVTADGIPVYGNHVACTRAQADVIAFQFATNGADTATQQWAVYIASREGGCRFDAVNQNLATQDDSHCAFQLNVLSGVFGPNAQLGRLGWTAENVKVSLDGCARAASDLWVYCGRGPWTAPYSCRPPWKDASAVTASITANGDG